MTELLLPLGLAVGLPLLLSGVVAFRRPVSLLDWLLSALLCGGIAVYMYLASPVWAWIGVGWRVLPPTAAAAAVLWSARRLRTYAFLPPARRWPLAGTALRCATVVLVAGLLVEFRMAGLAPAGAVDLQFPLEGGRFAVLHGGGALALNHHRTVPAQAYAIDIVGLNDRGRRARGVRPEALDAYEIFGRVVVAPCHGIVSGMSDGMPDAPVGLRGPPPAAPAGNHVRLACRIGGDEITVLFAHFQRGGVAVARGDRVRRGAPLGRVGNSGNSTEPHLHVHAVRGRAVELKAALATAEAVPLTFGGRFLTRNDIVRVPSRP